jgi:hypothetical protein
MRLVVVSPLHVVDVVLQLLLLLLVCHRANARIQPVLPLPDLELMSESTRDANVSQAPFLEHFSRTKLHQPHYHHRIRRQVIAGQMYDWTGFEIPYSIWGGDSKIQTHSRI